MPELQRLHVDHAPAVRAFEAANRAYFAASISDRGDDYFDRFAERYTALLAEQEAGVSAFYVLVAEDGPVPGGPVPGGSVPGGPVPGGPVPGGPVPGGPVPGGSVLGRFNLIDIEDRSAQLGYRVAEAVAGHGVATATVRELCRLAATRHGLRTLRAAAATRNRASQRVLAKAGFVATGPADPAHLGGQPGTWYQRDLTSHDLTSHDLTSPRPD
jgi:ribosomal-protein-alanine N-acetyltransferase